ncbi:hypothetical protein E2C01_002966 [Portunus trituberculatus]|uniref:Uncharacterized protein n=1 Tax=Portunus trituberculatus TaxID=210409 RepID=A0A5B7CKW8_PORTR|nr:hypothetical protein [Portunus trituberculatus]
MALTLSVTVTVFSKCRLWEAEQHSSITAAGGTLKVTAFRTLHRPRLITALLVEVSLELLVAGCNSSFTIIQGERNVVEFVPKSFSIVSYLPTFLL